MIDDDEQAIVGGIKIGKGNKNIKRKPAVAPLCPSRIPHDLKLDQTRAAAVGS
jgi:hypothetical protein